MESYTAQDWVAEEEYDFIQEYLGSLSSPEEVEELKQRCKDVLAKREREMVAIDALDPTPDTKRPKVVAESPDDSGDDGKGSAPCPLVEYDSLSRKFSRFLVELCSVASSHESSQQLQALGPDCLDAFFRTQYAMNDLISVILSKFPYILPSPRTDFIMSAQQRLTVPDMPGDPDIHSMADIEILDRVDVSVNEPKFRSYMCQAKTTGHICEVQVFPLDPAFNISSVTERVRRWKEASRECAFIEKIYSVFTDGAFIYFIIEPLIGPTLLDSIRQGATVSNEKAVRRIALQVMSSLETLHRNKIVYCDLCPENIYVCKDESVKLMSYPLIKRCLGSIAEYVAPELMLCRRSSVTHCTDLWCFGMLLYEMYTGFPLFGGDSNFPTQTYVQILAYKEKDCERYCEHMPESLREVVCSLLRSPERRAKIAGLRKAKFFVS